jgi:site-specific recombinase
MSSQYLEEMQSSSVTSSGSLWQHVPVRMAYKSSHLAWQRENIKHRFHEDMARYQKNSELLDLLRSWREGDETEQRDTWEYLKQALDEDRLSERKLFP